ncbi:hypothetical protein N7466_010885 [Penicillium verhagenii]|uniref:uncharacterized protein n=1 Tax=Penicillium verhagenii TaxID=1562060 RepID=UPI00254593BF|nr:uncharacterized protein N7466_010885 [Penicillium verhagenii]KAJ5917331.1 hypothetical protein N7466_010885 [Penicillium verhagenii]
MSSDRQPKYRQEIQQTDNTEGKEYLCIVSENTRTLSSPMEILADSMQTDPMATSLCDTDTSGYDSGYDADVESQTETHISQRRRFRKFRSSAYKGLFRDSTGKLIEGSGSPLPGSASLIAHHCGVNPLATDNKDNADHYDASDSDGDSDSSEFWRSSPIAADDISIDQDPANEDPANEDPANEEPANEEPANEEPANEEPANEEPANEEPANEDAAEQAAADEVDQETDDNFRKTIDG